MIANVIMHDVIRGPPPSLIAVKLGAVNDNPC